MTSQPLQPALSTKYDALSRNVYDVAMTGLRAADPYGGTLFHVTYDARKQVVRVGDSDYSLGPDSRVYVVGGGKASHPIMRALVDVVGDRIVDGVVAVRDPGLQSVGAVRVIHSDHPIPSARSMQAAEAILECVSRARAEDLVISCFTGGSSSLVSLPPPSVSLTEKRDLHRLLLGSGLGITDINLVRKHVSSVKGGRVAKAAAPARLVNLTVSDVAGSPVDTVTDLVVQDTSSPSQARDLLHRTGLWDAVPATIRGHLSRDTEIVIVEPEPQTVIVADGAQAVSAMHEAALNAGYRPVVVDAEVEGEARDVAEGLCREALRAAKAASVPIMLLGCGGESVVTLDDNARFGAGGPNQECALVAADRLRGIAAAAIFLDTDGSDGGTAYAGALVAGDTAANATAMGVDLDAALRAHAATRTCVDLGAAVVLGHTGTNVNDLFAIAVSNEERAG